MLTIFLDIDSVLNCFKDENDPTISPIFSNIYKLSVKRVELLTKTLVDIDHQIVITSTWRRSPRALKWLVDFLSKKHDLNIIGCTDLLEDIKPYGKLRSDEITKFIIDNCIDNHVILDDCKTADTQTGNFIHVDFKTGLTQSDCDSLLKFQG